MTRSFNFEFDNEFQYREIPGLDPSLMFPAVVVGIVGPTGAEDLLAIVDTGATYSLFNGKRARSIGLDLLAGKPIRLGGLSGSLSARLHRITLEILGAKIDCEVAFSESEIQRELLGRHELFPRVRFGFREGFPLAASILNLDWCEVWPCASPWQARCSPPARDELSAAI